MKNIVNIRIIIVNYYSELIIIMDIIIVRIITFWALSLVVRDLHSETKGSQFEHGC